ncbi:TPA: hypothetical protein PXJ64_001417 [Yersinia enterocolitica]|nr:hypothetical protein [Yersinia enterocolitica]EKN5984516.1 hypothetical protein [Yersinia enterocolitica]EKN5989285.1 hypothetical protein [Yersinia enterocolitica]ELX2242743.1 hypothetical protein [Yersinia enterocolitica]HDL6715351.1 hypothetical protein [Yersinia enterocolitica]
MARNDSFNQPWASAPAQFERPGDGLIARGWAGGASEDPPEAKWENWWHNRVDLALQELQNLGQLIWFTDAPYQAGARVSHGGNSYIALSENTGVEPTGTLDIGVWRKEGASTYLQTANNLAEIAAAGPEAIKEAHKNLDLDKMLGDVLQKTNNLSEIKDAGPDAVAQALKNLGLDDVIHQKNTDIRLDGQLTIQDDIRSILGELISGNARLAHDGNIFADVWGDSLFAYINRKLPKVTTVYINAGTPESPYRYPVRSRQTFGNPFPGRIIECKAELFINNIWGPTGFIYSSDNSWGVTASPFDNSARIVVQSGRTGTAAISENAGGAHGISYNVNDPLPIRLKIWTVD